MNYVLLRMYALKGLYPTAILGGLINSTATVAEMVSTMSAAGFLKPTVAVVLLTSVAMFSRNLIILAIFSTSSVRFAVLPLLAMAIIAAAWAYRERKNTENSPTDPKLVLTSPVSLKKVLRFAGMFLGIQILATLAQRHFGSSGLQVISVLGGLFSSASTTAAAANLVMHGKILPNEAGMATVLTSIASLLINLPIVQKQVRDKRIVRDLYIASLFQAAVGDHDAGVDEKILHFL